MQSKSKQIVGLDFVVFFLVIEWKSIIVVFQNVTLPTSKTPINFI